MGSVLKNPTAKRRFVSQRQRAYYANKRTDRGHNTHHEQSEQNDYCKWFKETLPGIHLRSDTGSGAFNSNYAKEQHNRQQSHSDEPDITIFAARRGYHGLIIEMKRTGFELRMKSDGRKIRTKRDSKGRVLYSDYKIRKKGDWVDLHTERQAKNLEDYNREGYCAKFCVGLEKAKQLTCWYFEIPYEENSSLF